MGHLMAVKDRQSATDNMFEPLKETIELLQSYDHVMSDAVHQQLEVYTSQKVTKSCYHVLYIPIYREEIFLLLKKKIFLYH